MKFLSVQLTGQNEEEVRGLSSLTFLSQKELQKLLPSSCTFVFVFLFLAGDGEGKDHPFFINKHIMKHKKQEAMKLLKFNKLCLLITKLFCAKITISVARSC